MSLPDRCKLQGYLRLCRAGNLPTVWMNVLAGSLLSGTSLREPRFLVLLLAVSAMYCGGMAMNDAVDWRRDGLRRPDRPIPSGRVTRREAAGAAGALFAISVALFAALGGEVLFLTGILLLCLVLLYNLVHNLTILAVIPMGGCRFMVYLAAGLASSGVGAPLLALAGVQAAYVILLSLLARLEKMGKVNRSGRPLIPVLLAGIPVVDGLALGLLLGPVWALAGVGTGMAALGLQTRVRGD
jgi:4-hydroxybenzoate polyprenyltransferase